MSMAIVMLLTNDMMNGADNVIAQVMALAMLLTNERRQIMTPVRGPTYKDCATSWHS